MKWVKPQSLYLQLLMFLGLPLLLLWGLSAFNSYVSALQAATQAYDRTLLSSARTVSERLVVRNKRLEVNVPWVVLDSFELNMNDRLYYKVVDPAGQVMTIYLRCRLQPRAPGFIRRWRGFITLNIAARQSAWHVFFSQSTRAALPVWRKFMSLKRCNRGGIWRDSCCSPRGFRKDCW